MRQAERQPTGMRGQSARNDPPPGAPGGAATDPTFHERLRVPPSWWLVILFIALSIGAVTLRFQESYRERMVIAAVTAAVSYALMAWPVIVYGRATIEVSDGMLRAGRAELPLSALGECYPLDEELARAVRGPEADARAFMLLRSYVRTAVRVDVADPDDPTPYLYLSTRRPADLVDALTAARPRPDAA